MASNRKRIAGIGLAIVAASTAYGALQYSELRARYTEHRLSGATTHEERLSLATQLFTSGNVGRNRLFTSLNTGDEAMCASIGEAIQTSLVTLPAIDPLRAECATRILATYENDSEPGQVAVLNLAPEFLKCSDPAILDKVRVVVKSGLGSTNSVRVIAAKIAARPGMKLHAELQPLLHDAESSVRASALLGVGTANDTTLPDEELFRWLNDPASEVRTVCEAVLQTRGRSATDISMGRRLTHPNATERLSLLLDLAEEPGRDVGPWLEYLSRDPEPAVRAAAARVAIETKVLFANWIEVLAKNDPDATVRQVATYHRSRANGTLMPTSYAP